MAVLKKKSYATQKDIARLANVSQSAVAAALGRTDKIRVGKKTQEKILKAARQLNYSPNQSASITRRGRSKQVTIIFESSLSFSLSRRLQALSRYLCEHDFTVIPRELRWINHTVEQALEEALRMRTEAIVLASSMGPLDPDMHRALLNSPVPTISLGGPSVPGLPLVAPDFRKAFRELTARILETGRRNLFFMKRYRNPDIFEQIEWKRADRLNGFLDAVRHCGAKYEVIDIWNKQPEVPKNDHQLAAQGLPEILEKNGGKAPDAVICANDNMALGVIYEAYRRKIKIPKQMAVTGCDGEDWSAFGAIPLTTIVQPSQMMGQIAGEILIQMLKGNTPPQMQTLLPCEIVYRESCPME